MYRIIDGIRMNIGTFTSEVEAAKAYDEALILIGEQPVNFH